LARRFTASSDFFEHEGRNPLASVNMITAHDGMTLTDLTSYAQRHNERNGENNADGHHNNLSANAGVEGPSQDEAVLAVRGQWRRALLATLLCSQGTPQLLAGDEFGQTQGGNNNAYCQDNETSWLDWPRADTDLASFVAGLIHLRRSHAALRHASWFATEPHPGASLTWRNPDGSALTASDWRDTHSRSFACLMEVADADGALTERWYLMFNASVQACTFALPPGAWVQAIDSAAARVLPQADWALAAVYTDQLTLVPRTLSALVQPVNDPGRTEELAFLSEGAAS
jgi:glycogen operon protein